MTRLAPMIALVRATNGAAILVPADMIGPVEEIIGGVKQEGWHSAPCTRVTLRDHSHFDVTQAIEDIAVDYTDIVAEDIALGKDAR